MDYYLIDEIFITNYVMYSNEEKKFINLPRYFLPYNIVKYVKDDCYVDFTNQNADFLKHYKKCETIKERDIKIFWGELVPIHSYLNDEELGSGLVSHEKLYDIYYLINNVKAPRNKNQRTL